MARRSALPLATRGTQESLCPFGASHDYLWLRQQEWLREQRGAGAEQYLIPENTEGKQRGEGARSPL